MSNRSPRETRLALVFPFFFPLAVAFYIAISSCKAPIPVEESPTQVAGQTPPAPSESLPESMTAVPTVSVEEEPAVKALLAADIPGAFNAYSELVLEHLDEPDGEYYFERCLHIAAYTVHDFSDQIMALCERIISDSRNHLLIATARWNLARILLRKGRVEEAVAENDRLGFIKDWLVIGPFDNEGETGYRKKYPPEEEIDFSKVYEGKHGKSKWFVPAVRPKFGYVHLSALFRLREHVVAYALAHIHSPMEQEVAIRIASDGAFKIWLNGQCILKKDVYRRADFDQNATGAVLQEGWNRLLVKICEKTGAWRFSVRITKPDGSPVENLKYETDIGIVQNLPIPELTEPPPKVDVYGGLESILEEKLQQNPDDAISASRLAFLYSWKSVLDENDRRCRHLLRKAVQLAPNHARYRISLSGAETDRNRVLQELRKAIEIEPNSPYCYLVLAHEYRNDIESKQLELLEKALQLRPDFPDATLALANLYYDREGPWYYAALDLYKKVIETCPNIAYVYKRVAFSRYPDHADTVSIYRHLLSLDYTDNESRRSLAAALFSSGDVEEALSLFDEMVAINPYNYRALVEKAEYLKSLDRLDDAIACLESALAICPEDTDLLQILGNYYHLAGNTQKALELWERALVISPALAELAKRVEFLKPKEEEFWHGFEEDLSQYIEKARICQPSGEETARILLKNDIVSVNPDGTSKAYVQLVVKVFTEKGVNDYRLVYATPGRKDYYAQSRAEVKRAQLIKSDGRTVEGAYEEGSAYAWFEKLDKGDTILFECRIDETCEPRYKGYIGLMIPFQLTYDPVDVAMFTLIAPQEKQLYYEALSCEPEFSEERKGNLIVRRWTLHNIPQIHQEPNMPSFFELIPYIHVSTFKTWDEVSEWYNGLARDQFETSPEMASFARDIAGDLDTPEQKVSALFHAIVSEIRYEHLALEDHGYKPFKASDTFVRKYGDCKDTATLLITLLKEVGVDANFVLIRTTEAGLINTSIPSMKIFDHAIVHVVDDRGQDLFLDTTARYCGYRELPSMNQGAVAFIVYPDGKGRVLITPHSKPEENLTETTWKLKLNADGSADATETHRVVGVTASLHRYLFQEGTKWREQLEKHFYNPQFGRTNVTDVKFSDLSRYNDPVIRNVQMRITEFARRQDGKLFFKPVLFPLEWGRTIATTETRHHDLILTSPYQIIRRIEFTLPEGYRVSKIPGGINLCESFGKYSLSVEPSADGKVIVNVFIELTMARIPKDVYPIFRQFCIDIDRVEDEEIVLEPIP